MTIVRASQKDDDDQNKDGNGGKADDAKPSGISKKNLNMLKGLRGALLSHAQEKNKKDELMSALESQGMTRAEAKKTLEDWNAVGINTTEDLRKILVRRSVASVVGLSLRLGFDVVAALVAWNAGDAFNHGDGIGNGILGVLSYGLALNYGLNAAFGVVLLAGIVASGNLFGADANALMKAVKDMAGEGEDIEVVAKAKQTANMIKVVQSLSKVSSLLSEKLEHQEASKLSSLERLSAYLTIQKAERDYGFDASKHDISNAEVLMLAADFARFDANDDGALELSEVQKMFDSVGAGDMTAVDAQAAIDLLDDRGSGLVEFDEFVQWYANLKDTENDAENVEASSSGMEWN